MSARSPEWYWKNIADMQAAMTATTGTFAADSTILLLNVARRVIVSLISRCITVLNAPEYSKSTLIPGAPLRLFGIGVEIVL
jgi:hypothetical protein